MVEIHSDEETRDTIYYFDPRDTLRRVRQKKLCHFYTHRLVRLAAQRMSWRGTSPLRVSDSWYRLRGCRRCCQRARLPCLRARLRYPRCRVGSECQWSSGNRIRLDYFNLFNSRPHAEQEVRALSNKNVVIVLSGKRVSILIGQIRLCKKYQA